MSVPGPILTPNQLVNYDSHVGDYPIHHVAAATLPTDATDLEQLDAIVNGAISIGAPGVPSDYGLSVVGTVISADPADATHPGQVSIASQSFAGTKTFLASPILPGAQGTAAVALTWISGQLDLSGSVAFVLDTLNSFTFANEHLLSLRNAGVEKLYVDKDGNITAANFSGSHSGSSSGTNTGDVTVAAPGAATANGLSITGQVLSSTPADATHPGHVTTGAQTLAGVKTFSSVLDASGLTNTTGSASAAVKGAVADGASAVGVILDNTVPLTTIGAKCLSIRNATVEKASIDKDGIGAFSALAVAGHSVQYGTAAPVTGTWAQGDIVYNTACAPGGNVGWICTTGGTSGTWKTFGQISL